MNADLASTATTAGLLFQNYSDVVTVHNVISGAVYYRGILVEWWLGGFYLASFSLGAVVGWMAGFSSRVARERS